MVAFKQFSIAAVALIFAALTNADRVLSLSPFAELVHDYDKGKGMEELILSKMGLFQRFIRFIF